MTTTDSTKASERLLPCPLCHYTAMNVAGEYITCGNPMSDHQGYLRFPVNGEAWNTRTTPQTQGVMGNQIKYVVDCVMQAWDNHVKDVPIYIAYQLASALVKNTQAPGVTSEDEAVEIMLKAAYPLYWGMSGDTSFEIDKRDKQLRLLDAYRALQGRQPEPVLSPLDGQPVTLSYEGDRYHKMLHRKVASLEMGRAAMLADLMKAKETLSMFKDYRFGDGDVTHSIKEALAALSKYTSVGE